MSVIHKLNTETNLLLRIISNCLLEKELGTKIECNEINKEELFKKISFSGLAGYIILKPELVRSFFDSETLQKLKKIAARNVIHNLRFQAVFLEINRLFKKENIPFLFLKGFILSDMLYGRPEIRPLLDIDLMIKPEHVLKATNILTDNGATKTKMLQSPLLYETLPHDVPLNYKGITIELHTSLLSDSKPGKSFDQFGRENQEKYSFSGLEVSVLKPAMYCVYLTMHLFHHIQVGKFRLLWFVDVASMRLKYREEDIQSEVNSILERFNITSEYSFINYLLIKYFSLNKALNIELKKTDNSFPQLESLFVKVLNESKYTVPDSYYSHKIDQIKNRGKLWPSIIDLIFPSREYLVKKYNPSNKCIFLGLYIWHPVKVLIKMFSLGLKLMVKKSG